MAGDDPTGPGPSARDAAAPDAADRDHALLDALGELLTLADETPPEVLEAARALHDWARVDAELARIVELDAALTRHGPTPHAWEAAWLEVEAEVQAAGYRRRRVEGTVELLDGTPPVGPMTVEVQDTDGERHLASLDDHGAFEVEVPAGSLRIVVVWGGRRVVTPWFAT